MNIGDRGREREAGGSEKETEENGLWRGGGGGR